MDYSLLIKEQLAKCEPGSPKEIQLKWMLQKEQARTAAAYKEHQKQCTANIMNAKPLEQKEVEVKVKKTKSTKGK